jgi:hypothetical protein
MTGPRLKALIALAAVVAAGPAAAGGLNGDYVVVAVRSASTVASTLDMQDPQARAQLIGTRVSFGETLAWLDGRFCDDWSLAALDLAPLEVFDPMLSDLQTGAADGRVNLGIEVRCAGGRFASLLKVDERVLVTPYLNGAWHVVLERPPTAAEVTALQHALAREGLDPGPADGIMRARTREALSAYAERLGAAYRFANGVVTESLLEAVVGEGGQE